ncbi:hypothetical protein [Tsukamurella sp. NPDC003166]|uniref:hypothetical protein n=1 Tax=Tsukamurella sp. NPDC003166 TaxID=3154444 RepID=UPI00339EA2B4
MNQPFGSGAPAPKRPNRALWWAVGVAVVLVLAVAVAAGVVVVRSQAADGAREAPSSIAGRSTTAAAGCGTPGRSSTTPVAERVVSGPLSFPASAAPGWKQMGYTTVAESVEAQGLYLMVPGEPWQAHVEIGMTNFDAKVPSDEAARRLIPCIAAGAAYNHGAARVEAVTAPEAVVVDGVRAHRVTARFLVDRSGLSLAGDVVTVVVIDSAPQAYFESDTPIGDTALAAVAQQVFEQLKVARDV